MRAAAATIGLALLLALAGCGMPFLGGDSTPTPPGTEAPGTPGSVPGTPPPAPATDVLGWEDGYWHNATLDVDNSDGLNESERAAVVARAKARVEYVRRLEFNGSVNISVISRANYSAARDDTSDALRRFDNAKFEALFLIGGDTDSIETQEDTRNASVAGYYSHERNAIVVVSESATPTFESERTLAHELVHALQDQHLGLGDRERVGSRDAHNGRNGLIEGDPTTVQYAYLDHCGEAWSCIEAPANGTDEGNGENASTPHLGVYLLQFFPYSDGPDFVATLRDGDSWEGVNAAYENPPETATEVIYPERYRQFQVREVDLADDLRDGWERVRPPDRPDHARIGQSGLAAMFAYTLYDDYNRSAIIGPQELLNMGPDGLNETDPINYDLAAVRGWTGDRMHVYARGDDLAYRWRLTWDSAADAQRFAATYRGLLQHWGGSPGGGGLWRVPPDSPFTGAYHLAVRDDTVTIAHADTAGQLADVSPAAR